MGNEENEFKVGDRVEVLPDIADTPGHPFAVYVGQQGTVHWVPDADDPNHDGHQGIIVLFDNPEFPGLSSPKSHFRKVE